jgi:AcrR family transcriptional regulator
MLNEVAPESLRDRLVISAISLAGQEGIASVTDHAVAESSGMTLDEVHEYFPSRESLLAAMGDMIVLHLSTAMRDAVAKAAASLDVDGVRALRILLHSGMSAIWPLIESTPHEQILTYELTIHALRYRWNTAATNSSADLVAREQYRMMDVEAQAFLQQCAALSKTKWLEPVSAIATFALSLLQGMILRWLVDGNDEVMITLLDDLVATVSSKATEARQ